MIECKIDIKNIPDQQFNCGSCDICFVKKESRVHQFKDDLISATIFEKNLKNYILGNLPLLFKELEIVKNADLTFFNILKDDELICRIEAKFLEGLGAVYMEKMIKLSGKESLVIDEPKLEHYIQQNIKDNKDSLIYIPTYVVWFFGRPCEDFKNIVVFEELTVLKDIYMNQKFNHRKFTRKTTENDFDENGNHKGITKKFHFSIKETRPIYELLDDISNILSFHNNCLSIIQKIESIQKEFNIEEETEYNFQKKIVFEAIKKYGFKSINQLIEYAFIKSKDSNNKKYFIFEELFNEKKIVNRLNIINNYK